MDIAVLQTTVSEPEQTGSYMSKHITYLIRTEPYTYLVRRRYTDFVWLREVLQKRYIGMLLPSLPPKTYQSTGSGNSSTSGLVKVRRRAERAEERNDEDVSASTSTTEERSILLC